MSSEEEGGDEQCQAIGVSGIPKFTPNGDPTQLCNKWKRWKRAFLLYIEARGVTKPGQKLALLLHNGGMDFQEMYYSLVPESENKNFEQALEILDNHFIPTANVPFERHQFRQLYQQSGETINQFVCRLRQKALSCDFASADEQIRDQVIEKCADSRLRRKFLEKNNLVLRDLLATAQAHEAVETQLKGMSIAECNYVKKVNKNEQSKMSRSDKPDKKIKSRCYRCDKEGHYASDKKCPARKITCQSCHKEGHYTKMCRTKKKVYQVKQQTDAEAEEGPPKFAFNIQTTECLNGVVNVSVGGVGLGVLIDSGASCNIVDENTWVRLKNSGIKCESEKVCKKLFAYGQVNPIETIGQFYCKIACQSTKLDCRDEFVVIKGQGKSLLGKTTSEKLNLLRVGPPMVCTVTSENAETDIRAKYADIFSGVGKLKNYQVKLHVDDKVLPIAQPVRRIPFGLREKVEKHLLDLQQKGIIEPVSGQPTTWVSPLVVVPKPGGDIRVCVDMRRANEAIIRERHPIPTVDEVLHDMNGATVFSKIDLKWGFHQVELDKDSRDITTFCSHIGLFRYARLMFGINAAPEKYHKIVQDLFKKCLGVANIADDLIIYGCGIQEHDERLFKVLDILRSHGLTVNGKKCQFRMTKLTFFGHDLSSNGVSPSEEKVAAIRDANAPKTVSEVRSFMGLVQYSAKFLPNMAEVSEPLRLLTRKDQPFVWGNSQQKAFTKLKSLISSVETLAYFKEDCTTRVIGDAGPTGLGAVLVQKQGENWRVISYASRNLSACERRYSQTEKEALALVWACERFNLYLFGREFELETDHKPLECIYGKKSKPSARIERWVLRLQGYQYNVIYRPGKSNIADALSRLNCTNSKDTSAETEDYVRVIAQEATPASLSPHEIEIESAKDPELCAVRGYINTGNWDNCKLPGYLCIKDELCTLGQLILRGSRICIPRSLRKSVVNLAHEGHQGIVKTKERLRTKVWWPCMDKDAERLCKTCHGCQLVSNTSHVEPMQRTRPPEGPWQDLAIDLMGPLPSGESILVIVDYYSRYYEVCIMKSTTTTKVIECLIPIFSRWGFPFSLKSDNGPQFISEEFKAFLKIHGIEHRLSPPLWPQANGEVERQNRTILKCLKIAKAENKNLHEELHKFLLAYRSTPHATTGATPAKLMINREIRTKLPELREKGGDESVRDHDWQTKLAGKQYSDQKRGAVQNDIKPGDNVLLKNVKQSGKLATKFENVPYTVSKKEGHEITVQSKDGVEYSRDSSYVKPYLNDSVDSDNGDVSVTDNSVITSPTPETETLPQPIIRRSSRNVQIPKKYDDFVVDLK